MRRNAELQLEEETAEGEVKADVYVEESMHPG